jgi:hypothetical protein
LSGFLERRSTTANTPSSSDFVRSFAGSPLFNRIRLAWQAANYAWDSRVLSYDETARIGLFNSLGAFGRSPISIASALLAATCVIMAAWFAWIRFRTRTVRDQLKIAYESFCAKLARRGAVRQPIEGPRDFSIRAAGLLPDRSDQIRQISEMYIALRYQDRADLNLRWQFAGAVKQFH